ncbi:MAG: type II toxin-antitoxin system RelE/ParE family toxin [Xanthobacteraceae bacterium]
MPTVKRTAEFDKWLRGLKDVRASAKVLVRAGRLALGNPGDVAPVGEGISEMRIDFGPGYRIYFKQKGNTATLLYGGDKDSQGADIAKAKDIAGTLED